MMQSRLRYPCSLKSMRIAFTKKSFFTTGIARLSSDKQLSDAISKGKRISFLWNIMDRKTRFLLASKLSQLRDHDGDSRSFREAQKNAHGNYSEAIFCDSLQSYNKVPFMNAKGWNPKLIQNCGVNKGHDKTNNRIERMNGTLRERVKVQRGWKSFESAIAEGQRLHYNFVKPHHALEGQTPAQRANLSIENKWSELLKLALTNQSRTPKQNGENN